MAVPKHAFDAARSLLSIPVAAFIKSEAAHLPSGSGIVVVHARERIGDALIKLAQRSILSAPLIDDSGRVAGFFDVKNVVKAFTASDTEEIEVIRANIGPGEPTSHPLKKTLRGRFVDLPVSDLPASSDGHYLFSESDPQLKNVSMQDLVQTCLLRGSSHRVAVYIPIGETGLELLTIVSASDVIRYLFERCDAFDSMASTSLADLGLVYRGIDRVPRGVIRVDASAAALDAFELMAVHDVSALAIVDSAGKLVANLSPSDLRVVLPGACLCRKRGARRRRRRRRTKLINRLQTTSACWNAPCAACWSWSALAVTARQMGW